MANSTSFGGIGFAGALTVLFVGLKLGKVIDWSWWKVLWPIWASMALFVLALIVFLIVALVKKK